MTDKEKFRKEVEKLKSNLIYGACSSQIAMETMCKEEAYNEVLALLDTMQEESVSEDLEEACEQLAENARKHKAETLSPFFSPTDYKQGVIDGAKWQKEHPWKPSKEQIEALEHSLGDYNIKIFEDRHEILKSLYNDLKKLKEE